MVTSVHSLSAVHMPGAKALVRAYWAWLDSAWGPLVGVEARPDEVRIRLLGVTAIRLESVGPAGFAVRGGALARPGGVFLFAVDADGGEIALKDFVPRLPLWLYRLTHGPIHEWSMQRFASHLQDAS